MYAVDPAWYTAHDAPGKPLTVVVQLLALGRTLSNVPTPAAPAAELLLLSVQSNSIGTIQNTLDPWSGVSQIGQVQLAVSNATGFALTLGPGFRKSAVKILLGIGVLSSLENFLPLFTGHVEQVVSTGPVCTITLVPGAFAWHRDLSVLLGDVFLSTTEDTQASQAIPLLVGRNIDVATVPVSAVVSGTLAQDLTTTDEILWIREFAARFPATGTLIIGETAETLTYSQRQIVEGQGGSVLVLSGLSRPAPAAHSVGTLVAVDLDAWHYLIGYQCTVLAVRRDGRLLAPTAYTVEEIAIPSMIPATVVTFATSQADHTITVDVDGSNIDPTLPSLLVNGGFETGTTTGWTLTGATGTVTTGDTPDQSTYKLELTGGSGTNGTLAQDFPVTPERGLVVTVAAQCRTVSLASPLDNPSFEDGDASGWTYTLTASHPELTVALTFGANPGGAYYGQQAMLKPTAAALNWALAANTTSWYRASFVQSCTVEAAIPYIFDVTVRTSDIGTWFTREDGELELNVTSGTITVRLVAEPSEVVLAEQQQRIHSNDKYYRLTGQVTTSGTALRVELLWETDSVNWVPATLRLFELTLDRVGQVSHSSGTVTLGVAGSPTPLVTTALPATASVWTPVVLSVVPDASPLRLTVATQYDSPTLAAPLWVDAVQVEEEGRHPVEVIRWLIQTFLPGLTLNEASFQAAYVARAAWRCGGQWRAPGHSRTLLTHLADQFELRYFENGQGEACLVPIALRNAPLSPTSVAFTSTTARDFTLTGEPPTQLATDLYVYYNARRGAAGDTPADYGAVVYATPEATTGELAWQAACTQVAGVHGIRQTLRYFAEAIQDQLTAHLKLAALVDRYTTVGLLGRCTSLSLRPAPLEIGDVVVVEHPALGPFAYVGESVSVSLDLSTPALAVTTRLNGLLGTEEGYEIPPEFLLDGTEEGYEV